ncbi:hypothetical protein GCM10007937_36970 [Mesorhizobium albiziae]|nr:hypothetical protein GCM10007937_36970 [Mesorhizobium albiziae]
MPDDDKFDPQKWFGEFLDNPRKAIVALAWALVAIAVVGIGGGIGGWFGDRAQEVLSAACASVHVLHEPRGGTGVTRRDCIFDPSEKLPYWQDRA